MKETALNTAVAAHHRKEVQKSFLQGLAVAIGSLARDHDQPSMAVDIMRCNGLTLDDLQECGIEVFDMKSIRKAWKASCGKRL